MERSLFYFIILQFYFLPIALFVSLIISWVVKKTIKKINRYLANLISLTPIILLFFISGLFGISAPYYIFLVLALEVFYLEEMLYEIKLIDRAKLIVFFTIVVLLYIFFFPKDSSYTQPNIPIDLINPKEEININNGFSTFCSCFGLDLDGSSFGTNKTYCLGIPHSCRMGKEYLPF